MLTKLKSLAMRIFRKLDSTQQPKTVTPFTRNPYFNSTIEVKALHELSHVVAMALEGKNDYLNIEDKTIKLKESKDKSGYFSYRRLQEPNSFELFIDMMICLSGFVGEIELLNLKTTNSLDDLEEWNSYTKRWLLHFNKDYIANPENELEIKWNLNLLDKHRSSQLTILKSLLRYNKNLIFNQVDILSKQKKMNNEEINDFLDKIEIPNNLNDKISLLMKEGEIKWN